MTSRHVYWYLRAYAFHSKVYDSNLIPKLFENHVRVLAKSIKNPSKIAPKWGPGGFLGRWGARKPRRPRDWFLTDLGVIWGSILGPIWEAKVINTVKKSILSDSKSLKTLNTLLDGFQHWFFIDFGAIPELFEGDFWNGFGGSPTRAR